VTERRPELDYQVCKNGIQNGEEQSSGLFRGSVCIYIPPLYLKELKAYQIKKKDLPIRDPRNE